MNLHRAIAKSCNTYFYTMARRIGIDRFSAMAKRLGLGQRFDLPVVSQSYGTIPDPAWKQRRYRQEWSQADTLNAAIGQGYVILNPLQLAIMAARVASGRDIQPRLVAGRYPAPAPLPFSPANFEHVRAGMSEVVNGNDGLMALAFMPKPVRELPWIVIGLVVAIAAFSILVLYSAAGGRPTWALPQAVRFLAFLVMAIGMSRLRPEWIKQAAFPAYVVVLILLVVVEAMGFVRGGAQRWINLGFINLQPSELMKPVIVIACAHFYALLPAREIRSLSAIWPAALLIGIPTALVLVQPDLGTASMIAFGGITVGRSRSASSTVTSATGS